MPKGYKLPILEAGQRFGKWKVMNKVPNHKTGKIAYQCECDCGNISIVLLFTLKNGSSNSCRECMKKGIKERAKKSLARLYSVRGNKKND